MSNLPSDVINESLDVIGSELVIGDPEEGTREAQVCLRAYGQFRRQLLRAAKWNFARREGPMLLLADATGNTPNVGNLVPQPWLYSYAYPTDCVLARFVPWNNVPLGVAPPAGNIQISSTVPLTGAGLQTPNVGLPMIPARFLVTTDFNNQPPFPPGFETPGVAPGARTVILTNVCQALLVYTADQIYPSLWDPLFRAALVAFIASRIALPLQKDKKLGMQLRAEQMAAAARMVDQARVSDGNEGSFNSDLRVDWMDVRNIGGGFGWWGGGAWGPNMPGVWGYGWDTGVFTGNTSAY